MFNIPFNLSFLDAEPFLQILCLFEQHQPGGAGAGSQCEAMRQLPSKSPPPILTSTPLYCPPLSPLTLHSLPYYILRPNSVIHMVGNTYVVLFWRQVQAAICSDVTCEEHHNTSDAARQTCRDTKVHLDIHPRS